jgi:hypothetical protein
MSNQSDGALDEETIRCFPGNSITPRVVLGVAKYIMFTVASVAVVAVVWLVIFIGHFLPVSICIAALLHTNSLT